MNRKDAEKLMELSKRQDVTIQIHLPLEKESDVTSIYEVHGDIAYIDNNRFGKSLIPISADQVVVTRRVPHPWNV